MLFGGPYCPCVAVQIARRHDCPFEPIPCATADRTNHLRWHAKDRGSVRKDFAGCPGCCYSGLCPYGGQLAPTSRNFRKMGIAPTWQGGSSPMLACTALSRSFACGVSWVAGCIGVPERASVLQAYTVFIHHAVSPCCITCKNMSKFHSGKTSKHTGFFEDISLL
jgi:hypothetical protein